jgi:hypothetical protein
MAVLVRRLASGLRIALGLVGIWFAFYQWLWFLKLPKHASARFCGNCFLGAVGIPIELGLLGLLLAAGPLLGIHFGRDRLVDWGLAAIGVLMTPYVLGVPVFVVSFLCLAHPIVAALVSHRVQDVVGAQANGFRG